MSQTGVDAKKAALQASLSEGRNKASERFQTFRQKQEAIEASGEMPMAVMKRAELDRMLKNIQLNLHGVVYGYGTDYQGSLPHKAKSNESSLA